jgi:uncharacterized protein YvpB
MLGAMLAMALLTMPPFCPVSAPIADQVQINVPLQCQMPELDNGCEVTGLSMLLQHAGRPVSRFKLAEEVAKDKTELRKVNGRIVFWGDPHLGFVGDITGKRPGYGVYHRPILQLLNRHLPGRGRDLTGGNFDQVLAEVSAGRPVVVWTTSKFQPVQDWVTWDSPSGKIYATFHEHAVLLVGFDKKTVTVNDPLDGKRKQVDRERFRQSWEQMGRQAVTYQ